MGLFGGDNAGQWPGTQPCQWPALVSTCRPPTTSGLSGSYSVTGPRPRPLAPPRLATLVSLLLLVTARWPRGHKGTRGGAPTCWQAPCPSLPFPSHGSHSRAQTSVPAPQSPPQGRPGVAQSCLAGLRVRGAEGLEDVSEAAGWREGERHRKS